VTIDEQTIRDVHERYNRGDFAGMRDLMHPDIEWDSRETSLDGKVIYGPDAVIEHLKPDFFDMQLAQLEEVTPIGRGFLLSVRFRARGAGSGIELQTRSWILWEVEDDLLRRVQIFLDHDQARAAAAELSA
jgi:ketosteroid isomerase-like protein